jgi:hypothetical protein
MMEKPILINVARDFGRYPAGRYLSDGPYSGEAFRQNLLVPALNKAEGSIDIELDGARGLASSFLEESFGGLVRVEGFDPQSLLVRLNLHSSDLSLVEEIRDYIASSRAKSDSH